MYSVDLACLHALTSCMLRNPIIAVLLLVASCDSPNTATPDAAEPPADARQDAALPDAAVPLTLPILSAGNHLGVFTGFETLPGGTAVQVANRLAEARTAGMEISRIHVSWSELEPTPGTFQMSALRNALAAVPTTDAVLVLVETIDSDGFSLPADLLVPGDPYGLAGGRRFDDPAIVARFATLIDALVPELASRHVFAMSVGNEPDAYFDDVAFDAPAGVAFRTGLIGFLTAARTRLQAALPGLAVGMTLREGSLELGRAAGLAPLLAAGDVAILNYYCQDAAFQVKSASTIPVEVAAMETFAAGLPIVLQEAGCPAGTTNTTLQASAALQAAWYTELGHQLATRPTLRAAFAFQLVDWSPQLAASYAQAYTNAGFPELGAKIAETLNSVGLLHQSDGTQRPAWPAFVAAIDSLE